MSQRINMTVTNLIQQWEQEVVRLTRSEEASFKKPTGWERRISKQNNCQASMRTGVGIPGTHIKLPWVSWTCNLHLSMVRWKSEPGESPKAFGLSYLLYQQQTIKRRVSNKVEGQAQQLRLSSDLYMAAQSAHTQCTRVTHTSYTQYR